MKNIAKLVCTLIILGTLVVPTTALSQVTNSAKSAVPFTNTYFTVPLMDDYDPLDKQIIVTVTIQEIRALKTMDLLSDPDFYVKVSINGNMFKSPVWRGMKYVEKPNWSASCEVPKNKEFVNITIELWDKDPLGLGQLCDISPVSYGLRLRQSYTAELTYSIATGLWSGDDSTLWDLSGYGRLNGCDDNSIYTKERDCELFFNITQTDFDGDGLPYWLETNIYHTSPLIDNRGEDADGDGVPIEWEHRFGLFYFPWYDPSENESRYYLIYDPNTPENHSTLDPDNDGLTNVEEYKTWQWGSDPFRKDIFIEIDQMELGPNNEGAYVPTQAYDLIRDAHAKHNIVWHIDDGRLGGGEHIPFKEVFEENDTSNWYWKYFMHGDAQNWRRGVFRWCIVAYNYSWAKGFGFGSDINGSHAADCFFLSTKYHEMRAKLFPILDGKLLPRGIFNREMNRAYVYAGVMMHETGHMLNIQAPGYDVSNTIWPWQVNYWRFANYKSCGNYRYVYRGIVDYSDGSHGKNDFDDWGNMDLTAFNPGKSRW
jgi:hypothetical protein